MPAFAIPKHRWSTVRRAAPLLLGGLLAASLLGGCADSAPEAYCRVIGDFYTTLHHDEGFGSDAYKYCLVVGEESGAPFEGLTQADAREQAARAVLEDQCGSDQLAQPEGPGQEAACEQLRTLLGSLGQ